MKNIIYVLIAIMAFAFGYFYRGNNTVHVSQQISLCEAKGGRYSLSYWTGFQEGYHENCKILEKEIDL